MKPPVDLTPITTVRGQLKGRRDDLVAVEEPLQIRVEHGPAHRRRQMTIATTMRTPGHDVELTRGFLFTEGFVTRNAQLSIRHCLSTDTPGNVILATMRPDDFGPVPLEPRGLLINSACGVCGAKSIRTIEERGATSLTESYLPSDKTLFDAATLMTSAQACYRHTGGMHAAALVDRTGAIRVLREDVGRHNALDKVIGAMLHQAIDPTHHFLVVSSRASFELVQKAVVARIGVLAAMGAPTSLAIETANHFGVALVGFLKPGRFNVYGDARAQPTRASEVTHAP